MPRLDIRIETITANRVNAKCVQWERFPKPGWFIEFITRQGACFYTQIESVTPGKESGHEYLELSLIPVFGDVDIQIVSTTLLMQPTFLKETVTARGHEAVPLTLNDVCLDLNRMGAVVHIAPDQARTYRHILQRFQGANFPLFILDPVGVDWEGFGIQQVRLGPQAQLSIQEVGVNDFIQWVIDGLPMTIQSQAATFLLSLIPPTPDFIPLQYFVNHPALKEHPFSAAILHRLFDFHKHHLFAAVPQLAFSLDHVSGSLHVDFSDYPPHLLPLAYRGLIQMILKHHLMHHTQIVLIAPEVCLDLAANTIHQFSHRIFLITQNPGTFAPAMTDHWVESSTYGDEGIEVSGKLTNGLNIFIPYSSALSETESAGSEAIRLADEPSIENSLFQPTLSVDLSNLQPVLPTESESIPTPSNEPEMPLGLHSFSDSSMGHELESTIEPAGWVEPVVASEAELVVEASDSPDPYTLDNVSEPVALTETITFEYEGALTYPEHQAIGLGDTIPSGPEEEDNLADWDDLSLQAGDPILDMAMPSPTLMTEESVPSQPETPIEEASLEASLDPEPLLIIPELQSLLAEAQASQSQQDMPFQVDFPTLSLEDTADVEAMPVDAIQAEPIQMAEPFETEIASFDLPGLNLTNVDLTLPGLGPISEDTGLALPMDTPPQEQENNLWETTPQAESVFAMEQSSILGEPYSESEHDSAFNIPEPGSSTWSELSEQLQAAHEPPTTETVATSEITSPAVSLSSDAEASDDNEEALAFLEQMVSMTSTDRAEDADGESASFLIPPNEDWASEALTDQTSESDPLSALAFESESILALDSGTIMDYSEPPRYTGSAHASPAHTSSESFPELSEANPSMETIHPLGFNNELSPDLGFNLQAEAHESALPSLDFNFSFDEETAYGEHKASAHSEPDFPDLSAPSFMDTVQESATEPFGFPQTSQENLLGEAFPMFQDGYDQPSQTFPGNDIGLHLNPPYGEEALSEADPFAALYEMSSSSDEGRISNPTPVESLDTDSLPIYKNSKPQLDVEFEPGERVFHSRYGQGVIKRIITMDENQIILNINFEGVGKRLLDPRLTQLEKVS